MRRKLEKEQITKDKRREDMRKKRDKKQKKKKELEDLLKMYEEQLEGLEE